MGSLLLNDYTYRYQTKVRGVKADQYSFYKNLFFSYASVVLLIVLCGFTWIDLEVILLLSSSNDLMLPSLGLLAIKLVGVVLIWQNFRDVS